MDCTEARALISAGMAPGAGAGQVPQLGFHLSACPACRAFRRIDLYDREQARRAQPSTPLTLPHVVPAAHRRRVRLTTGQASVGLALLMGTWLFWYLGLPLLRAWRDLGTMASLPSVERVVTNSAEPGPDSVTPEATITPVPETTRMPLVLRAEPTATPSPKYVAQAVRSNTPVPTDAPTPTPTNEPTVTPTPTDEPPATPAVIIEPTVSPTATSEPTALPVPPSPVPATATVEPPQDQLALAEAPPSAGAGGVTVLLLGLDARPGESTGRSDALVVAHIDPERQTAALLSLPRDLWVAIPGIGEGKINGAYVQGGAQTAAATVGQALGVKIDHTVVIDFAGFRSLIDALGGITVDVPRELYDSKFPTDDYGIVEAHFLPGPQLMDGKQALTYSRIRHPDSDFARMRRQQAVLIGISAKLRKLGAFQSLHEADRLTGALVPYVRTSLGRGTAAQLLWSLRGLDPAGVGRLILDGGMLQETTIGGSYALVADSGTLHSLGAQLTAP